MTQVTPLTAETLVPELLIKELTLPEKVSLLAGRDMWHTVPIDRVGLPSIRVSDGPNGVRGTAFFNGVPSSCFPCATALAATWDLDLAQRIGGAIADEAIAKGASCVLGPTCNIQRSPLGGRGFESYSEDPLLSGKMSAAWINGLQDKKISATLKHFIVNDAETERFSMSSEVGDRALREIYLRPFEIALKESNPWAIMSSYNRINGTHVSENPLVLKNILREEWGFDGLVMSDWWGTYSTVEAAEAGLDLEMPGATVHRGGLLMSAVRSEKITVEVIDKLVLRVLTFIKICLIPEVSAVESGVDTPFTRSILRESSAQSIVLLKNTANVLPVNIKKTKSIAVIGQNAEFAQISGGGSASMKATRVVNVIDGIKEAVGSDATVTYATGAYAHKLLPPLGQSLVSPTSGKAGFDWTWYNSDPFGSDVKPPVAGSLHLTDSIAFMAMDPQPGIDPSTAYALMSGNFACPVGGDWDFSVVVNGKGKLYVDGQLVVDNWTTQVKGEEFFGTGTREEFGSIKLEGGKTYLVEFHFKCPPDNGGEGFAAGLGAWRVGAARKIDPKEEIKHAVELAKASDVSVLVIGLNGEWESEGFDRKDMKLPPGVDDLAAAVLAAVPSTIVVTQSGTPIEMPWANQASTLLHAWFGGNEGGHAIADVIFGKVNPAAKLSLSFPKRLEDNPTFLTFPGENGKNYYGEGIYVGYRYYEKASLETLFPFGHGLSYTTFALSGLKAPTTFSTSAGLLTKSGFSFSVDVKNTGSIAGAEVVQVYVTDTESSLARPPKELKSFQKVFLQPGESKTVSFTLDRAALGYWDDRKNTWIAEKGEFGLVVGTSSADEKALTAKFTLEETLEWTGLS